MKRIFTILCLLLCISYLGSAQTIKGKVTDQKDQSPIIGATVMLKGTNIGSITDIDGGFELELPEGYKTLVASCIGYTSKEIMIEGPGEQNFELSSGVEINEVMVIGSRNATRTKLETPVPVDIIPISTVTNEVGQVDINQILTYIAPSFQSSKQAISDGTDHVDPGQLRGLGPDQTLILLNGKRRHQSSLVNVNGTVNRGTVGTDMSAIPASSVERIEILRDGAAAQYGSDAIAGVINIVLKQRTGLSGGISYGANFTKYDKNYGLYKINNISENPSVSINDGGTLQAGLNYGVKLGNRGHFNIGGEFIQREATNRTGTYSGRLYPNVNAQNRDDSIMAARSLSRENFDMVIGQSKMIGGGVIYNLDYNLNSKWKLYSFGGVNQKNGQAAGFYRYPDGINTSARKYAADVFKIYPNGFLPQIKSSINDLSAAVGVKGSLGKWTLDLSNTFGRNSFGFNVENSVNYTQAAISPNNLQTKFEAGKLSFVQNTVNADLVRKYDVLHGLNLALGGEFRLESFEVTPGEESSYKNYDTASGAVSGAQVFAGFLKSNEGSNSRSNLAGYVDTELDITKDFMIGVAGRFENYSDFGSTFNYKAATRYKVLDFGAIRASVSTGFRAPSLQQRFYAKTNTLFVSVNGNLVPQEAGTFTNESDAAKILGIPELKQETSFNYTFGITARPIKNVLEVSLDAYWINISDRIILTNNFNDGGNAALKAQLEAVGANQANFFTNAIDTKSRGIEAVINFTPRINLEGHSLRITVAGTMINNEVVKNADGTAKIKASDILTSTGQIAKYFNREDQSRIEVANPKQKMSLMANYKINKFSIMARAAYWGEVTYLDPTITSNAALFPVNAFTGNRETLDQTFSPKTIIDLTLGYNFTSKLGLTIGANNLFDTYQDIHTHSGNMSSGRFVYSRRVQQFGFNGRYAFARLRFDL